MTAQQLPLDHLPEILHPGLVLRWERFLEAGGVPPSDAVTPHELASVWTCSDFVARSCIRSPELLSELVASGDLTGVYPEGIYAERLSALLDPADTEAGWSVALRRFRTREMVRIAWRDLSGRSELEETTRDLSALADACIDLALDRVHRQLVDTWGEPTDGAGNRQRLVVLGMGKLGARELNFSSDIDLIFAYPEEGETVGGRRSCSNHEFFIRAGQGLSRLLGNQTADGFVFRVDMRLRPFGESGPLAVSFDAVEDYYQVHGREWERYAMIKARPVAGDRDAGERLMALLKPFVYRRYIDFGAFESLRDMKALIKREVQRKGLQQNVKLGPGGIREIEFLGQAFQLIRGGREPSLQQRPILPVLDALAELEQLPDFVVEELTVAYRFLRDVEHRLQMWSDQQTHDLPAEEDEEGWARLAFASGFDDVGSFRERLSGHRSTVQGHFEQVFSAPQADHAESDERDLAGVWLGTRDPEQSAAVLQELGYESPDEALRLLLQLREGHSIRALSAQGRQRIDRLMPLLLGAVGGAEDPDGTLARVVRLVETVCRRTAYLSLLVENPMALSQLVRLCSASSWIAGLLARHPLLLDELLDPRTLYSPPTRTELDGELRERIAALEPQDEEGVLDGLRLFKQSNTLRVAAADVMEAVPLMVVSDHLTDIAESTLQVALDQAWRHLVARHGRPRCGDSRVCDIGFAVIAYGKLGGIELGYGSDLDLVFLHSDDSRGRTTDGPKPVDNAVFYARLAQRLIHILNTRTPAGVLYEVDTRLRPSGAAGLLVSTVEAFAEYQRSQAWTWEHQALVRARPVAGDAGIEQAFAAVRSEILGRQRDAENLRREVREMRKKMRSNLARGGTARFDLKQDPGGIADIEFVVQYGVLAWAHRYPDLLEYTDNIRLLDGLARNGILSAEEAGLLSDAYRAYRAHVHRLTLKEQPALAEPAEFADYREGVTAVWQRLLEHDCNATPARGEERDDDG